MDAHDKAQIVIHTHRASVGVCAVCVSARSSEICCVLCPAMSCRGAMSSASPVVLLAIVLTSSFTIVHASSPGLLPIATTTLLDTTLHDRSCSCKLLLLRPISFSQDAEACLHITLSGRGTRSIARQATRLLSRALQRGGSSLGCNCVVEMSESNGASVASLPVVAGFMITHRRQLTHVSVLHARGLALNAVRVVSRLSRNHNIELFRTLEQFEAKGDSSSRHQLAVQVARRAAKRKSFRRPFLKW